MAQKFTIIVSTADVASVTIRDCLFKLKSWEKVHSDDKYDIYSTEGFDLIEISDYHVFQDGIDRELDAIGFKPESIIFASKHRSKENKKTLTVHHTGNISENKFGGRPGELSAASPRVACSLLRSLKALPTPFNISYEATHHGPSDITTPSVYVEIGSTIDEWSDPDAGMAVATAILGIKEDPETPVYVGIGGNHYAPRETALTLEAGVAFGHILPDHAIPQITENTLRQAFEKSGTRTAYIDRKSIPREQKERIEQLLVSLGYDTHSETEIRNTALSPWAKCPGLKALAQEKGFEFKPQFTDRLKDRLKECKPNACDACPFGITGNVDGTLISMAWKVDQQALKNVFSGTSIAYFLQNNGCPFGLLVGMDQASVDESASEIIRGSIEILKKKYEVRHDCREGLLYVVDRKFNPGKAKALGVPEGPMFGRLASGNCVTIKGIDVTPEMVFTETVTRIKLNNYCYNSDSGDGEMEPSIFSSSKTSRMINNKGEIIDSEEHQSSIIDGEDRMAVEPVKVGDTDEDIMQVMQELNTNVLVIGCGGGGSNSVSRMAMEGIFGAKMYAVNTDAQHLLHTRADKKFLIGKKLTRGFGAGSLPEVGENAAKESMTELKAALNRTDMVFITCGLGGGTGTGSAPVVASVAREAGALTIAIVTTPFKVEGAIRKKNADSGLAKLREAADTVIVVPNDKLLEVVPNLPIQKAFKVADEVLTHAVKGITELVTRPGLVNLDFADIKTVMSNGGVAMIGLGEGRGEDRAITSVRNALKSPLLDIDINGAKAAIVNVTGGEDMSISEAESIVEQVYNSIDPEARLIWGAHVDPDLEDGIRTMVIITGVKSGQVQGKESTPVKDTKNASKFGIDFIM